MKKIVLLLSALAAVVLASCDFNSKYQGGQNITLDMKALKIPKDLSYQAYDVNLKLFAGSDEVYNSYSLLEIFGSDIQPINFNSVPEGDFQMELVLLKGGFNCVHITTDASIREGDNYVELSQINFNGGWLNESTLTIAQGSTISTTTTSVSFDMDPMFSAALAADSVSLPNLSVELYRNGTLDGSTAIPPAGATNYNLTLPIMGPLAGDSIVVKLAPNGSSQEAAIAGKGGPSKFADYRLKFSYGP